MAIFIKMSLVIVFCFLLLAFYFMYPIFQTIKISEKMMATTIPYEQHPQSPTMHILIAGDSSAVGVGATDNTKTTAGRIGSHFPEADLINNGVSGARLKNLLMTLESEKEKQKHYDLLVLQIGGNDITHFTSFKKIKNEISQILQVGSKLSTKVILLTSGDIGRARVFHWPLSRIISMRTLKIRKIFMKEVEKFPNVSYVDLYFKREDDPFEKDLKKYYAPDSFHLTNEGYGIWYSQIQKKL